MNNEYKRALDFLDFLIQCYYKSVVTPNKKLLLDFLFKKNTSQADLDNFLVNWDIEVAGGQLALFLAYFMKENPNLNFPPYVKPRLNGLIKYNRFKKIKHIEIFAKIIKLLNVNEIIPVTTGEIAIKCLNADIDTDNIRLIIKCEDFKKLPIILQNENYPVSVSKNYISIDMQGAISFLIFSKFDFDTKYQNVKKYLNYLFCNDRRMKLYDGTVILPSSEDLAYIELIEIAKNIKFNTSFENIITSLKNLIFLTKSVDFEWSKVINTASKNKTIVQIILAARFIDEILPDFVPQELKNGRSFEQEIIDYYNICRFRQYRKNIVSENYSIKYLLLSVIMNCKQIFISFYQLIKTFYLKYVFAKILYKNKYFLRVYYKIQDRKFK